MMTILNPQDEVIVLAPYWVSYPEIVKMCYGIPVIVAPEDGRFLPRMEDITRQIGVVYQSDRHQQPEQSVGCGLPPGIHSGDRRILREERRST